MSQQTSAAQSVNEIRDLIDIYDSQVLLPAFSAAVQTPTEAKIDAEVSVFLTQSSSILTDNKVPVLDNLEMHLISSVENQTFSIRSVELVRALVRRNWLATAIMGAYKASGSISPLQHERVIAMKQQRIDWLATNLLTQHSDVIATLFQQISDDADVYQNKIAELYKPADLNLPSISDLRLMDLIGN